MEAPRLRKLRFNLKGVMVLMLGIAIGFSLGKYSEMIATRLSGNSPAILPYIINPPDVLTIDVSSAVPGTASSISGRYVVGPDGRINLGALGPIHVAGKTIREAQDAIAQVASKQQIVLPKVVLDVYAYNSKVFYIIERRGEKGDNVTQSPITGNETVLDAIARVGGVPDGRARLWIVRPADKGSGTEQVLTVDWGAIGSGSSTSTNYQLASGDRLYISN